MDLIDVREYRVATTRSDLALRAGERPIGGGTWVFSEPQPGTTGIVDLTGMGWPAIERDGADLVVSATCTIAQVRALPDTALFEQCADSLLASFKVQHVATVGGNLCLALPAGPMVSLAVALDAELLVWSPTADRVVPAHEFVTGVRRTVLGESEILRSIRFPAHALTARHAFRRIALSDLGRTGALVTGRIDADGRTVIGVTGATPRPYRLDFPEPPDQRSLAAAIDGIGDWYDDAHGAPDWRRAMSLRFAAEILEELS